MSSPRHVTLPGGFRAAGVACGIKASGREDLALVVADAPVSAAVVTTTNQVVGAPVTWCRQVLPRGYGKIRGMVINSGCSNVCTGAAGLADARKMAERTAWHLECPAKQVLVASTGIIGHRLPMDKIRRGIDAAAANLGTGNDELVLRAIMTTDVVEKFSSLTIRLGGKRVTIGGMVKGSGMIAPSMATMIAVVTTDAAVEPAALHKALTSVVGETFNAVTVDSDTSTSDTVAILASGAAGNEAVQASGKDFEVFRRALAKLCGDLAWKLAADGEGATKVIAVRVRGAASDADARIAAMSVANSPLFKCAAHGCDPNWGRIVMALGKSTARLDPQKLTVKIGPTTVFSRGAGRKFDEAVVSQYLAASTVEVDCNLNLGDGSFRALTCDLSREYIAINADYHT